MDSFTNKDKQTNEDNEIQDTSCYPGSLSVPSCLVHLGCLYLEVRAVPSVRD